MNKEIKERTDELRKLLKELYDLRWELHMKASCLDSLTHKLGFEVGYLIGINEGANHDEAR